MGNPLETCFCGDLKSQHTTDIISQFKRKTGCKFCRCNKYFHNTRPNFREDYFIAIVLFIELGILIGGLGFVDILNLKMPYYFFIACALGFAILMIGIYSSFNEIVKIQKLKRGTNFGK